MTIVSSILRWFGVDDETSNDVIGWKDSLSLPPVWYAHNKICGDVGMLPLDVKKRKGDGAINDERHDGYVVLREKPNDIQPPSVFKEQVMSHALLYGNGRAAVIRDMDRIVELIPMLPDRTQTVVYDGKKLHITRPNLSDTKNRNLFDGFETSKDGYLVFDDADVIHITGFTFNGVEGLGLLQIAQSTLRAGVNATKHVDNQLKRGFRGKLLLEAPAGAFRDEGKAREFLDSFNKNESGPENSGKAGMLREGIKANALNMSNNDAQFVELMKFSRQDVGMLFGVESMPGDGESVSYNSLEQKNLAYLAALDRWLVKWEEQCDIKLRTATQKRLRSHYFKFNRAAIYRTDLTTTMTALCNAITHRIMSPNEARAKIDMNPYEGGDAYENPAITPGSSSQSDSEDPSTEAQDPQHTETEDNGSDSMQSANARALEETIRSLLDREANNAISGAKSKNFCDWIDRNYAKWECKLADKLEAIGLDRDIARIHCDESKADLLRVAEESTQETLLENVKKCVSNWKNRSFLMIGE